MVSKAHLVTKQVADLVEPILDEMGFELVDVEYLSKYGRWVLRLYIDKEGGVTIDDCARVSGEIGDLIDVRDIIKHEYILEVSSPGLNRPLKKERDFIRATGKRVKVRMVTPVNGRRNFTGYLKNFEDGTLYVEAEGTLVALPWLEVDKANLVYEFNK
ncbi:MAG: ribosome maturation factor RimP [Deltaproteobacteria bacterium]|nr:MAG: ribosome maturation factor RimP [Deltaproteobacteria bacterium]